MCKIDVHHKMRQGYIFNSLVDKIQQTQVNKAKKKGTLPVNLKLVIPDGKCKKEYSL